MAPRTRLQEQAKALGDPTRHRIYRYVVESERPVDVGELTDYTELNHNAVRQHLGKLREAGLVLEEREDRRQPGRPRLLYRPDPETRADWLGPTPFERLATALAAALHEGSSAYDAGRATGEQLASAVPDGDPVDIVEALTERQGFRPRRSQHGSSTDLILDVCPFAAVAEAYPDIVCELHRGLADGLARATGDVEVTDLVVREPSRAGCRIRLRRGT